MKILLSLSSRKLRSEKTNPKNYPYADELIKLLKKEKIYTIQVRTTEDRPLSVDEILTDIDIGALAEVIQTCDTFVSVDNFIQHYAAFLGKRGVVIFGQSDPVIFGHPKNKNLLKDKRYLRANQFGTWEEAECNKEAFVTAREVMAAILEILSPA
jgi:ADP-heptose:LPS heptosyltransferase